jgi:hypothetical protein
MMSSSTATAADRYAISRKDNLVHQAILLWPMVGDVLLCYGEESFRTAAVTSSEFKSPE